MMKWPADRKPGDFQSDALFSPFLSPTNRGWQCWRIKRGKPDKGLAYVVNARFQSGNPNPQQWQMMVQNHLYRGGRQSVLV